MSGRGRRGPSGRRLAAWSAAGLAASALLALGVLCATAGCTSVGYLAQQASGQVALMTARRPVAAVVADPATSAPLRERLQLSQRLRDFAVHELALPDNDSYRRYADLHRPAAVWNVVAAPELSLQARTWCFPVVGCVGYRGYFELAAAEAAAAPLRAEGLEVAVYPVPAYSTLGWFDWWGGDPLLSSFIGWPEGELARLMFHELSHQVAYAAGDTPFNESYATAVERLGGARWMATRADARTRTQQAQLEARRADFLALVRRHRAALDAIYRSTRSDEDKRQAKAAQMAALRSDYATLKATRWGGFDGYDRWFAQANNATLATQSAYDRWVPAFEALFHAQGDDFARFHAEVKRLAALPAAQREAALLAAMPASPVVAETPVVPAVAAASAPAP